jgi:hypothetical protein
MTTSSSGVGAAAARTGACTLSIHSHSKNAHYSRGGRGDFRHAALPGSDVIAYARGLDSTYGPFADSPPLIGGRGSSAASAGMGPDSPLAARDAARVPHQGGRIRWGMDRNALPRHRRRRWVQDHQDHRRPRGRYATWYAAIIHGRVFNAVAGERVVWQPSGVRAERRWGGSGSVCMLLCC